jgi:hypothetical protein
MSAQIMTPPLSTEVHYNLHFSKSNDGTPRHLDAMVRPEILFCAVCQKAFVVPLVAYAVFCRLRLFVGGVGKRCGNNFHYNSQRYVRKKSLRWRHNGESHKTTTDTQIYNITILPSAQEASRLQNPTASKEK